MARDQEAATAGPDQSGGLRRTAVTGVGVVAPGGTTREAFWEMITAGRSVKMLVPGLCPLKFTCFKLPKKPA